MARKIDSIQIKSLGNLLTPGERIDIEANGRISANITSIYTEIYALDDISYQFDGTKTVFDLAVNTANITSVINNTIVDSKDLEVAVNGSILTPYVQQLTWPWITPYDSFKGFRVVGNKIIFYTAPSPGFQCSIILRNTSKIAQQRRYPFTPSSIALGD
jgi:hypothetical protein